MHKRTRNAMIRWALARDGAMAAAELNRVRIAKWPIQKLLHQHETTSWPRQRLRCPSVPLRHHTVSGGPWVWDSASALLISFLDRASAPWRFDDGILHGLIPQFGRYLFSRGGFLN